MSDRSALPRRAASRHHAASSGARLLGRRALLLGTLALAGCGRLRVGQPVPYTPPPPGIDDLYRPDLVTAIVRLRAGVVALTAAAPAPSDGGSSGGQGAQPDMQSRDMLQSLGDALAAQHAALLTTADLEDLADDQGVEDPSAVVPPIGEVPDPARDLAGLITELVGLRDLGADAARQVSGALARPVLAIAAHAGWTARRLSLLTEAGTVPSPPSSQDIVPTREVPTDDPPSIGARVDYDSTMETAQEALWVGGYAYEVLAAQTEGGRRRSREETAERLRRRAEVLNGIAEDDGCPVVVRQAVYPLPQGPDGVDMAALPGEVALSVLTAHIALAGSAPFERRSLPIAIALDEAHRAERTLETLPALPSLTLPEAAMASDGGG